MKLYFKGIFILIVFISFSGKGISQGVKSARPETDVKFTENKNQWDKKVLYRAQLDGGLLFLEKNCFTYSFYDKETLRENHVGDYKKKSSSKNSPIRSHAFRMTFLNAEKTVTTSAKQVTPDYCNYFIGNDKNKWAGNVKNYREVNYKELYPGIDMQIEGLQNSVKYNFIVAPLANPNDIELFYEGLDKIILEKGALKLVTSVNEMQEQQPFAYQWKGGKKNGCALRIYFGK